LILKWVLGHLYVVLEEIYIWEKSALKDNLLVYKLQDLRGERTYKSNKALQYVVKKVLNAGYVSTLQLKAIFYSHIALVINIEDC